MTWYLLRRVLAAIPVMFFVSVVVFALLPLSGGDPALTVAGPDQEPEVYERVRREYGFDRPLWEQYLRWAGRAIQGDLGRSILAAKFPVGDMIKQRLPVTAEIGALAVLFGIVVGVPLGVLAGAKRGGWTDFALLNVSLLGYVTPGFVWGVVLILIFAVNLRVLPPSGFTPFLESPVDNIRGLILPALTLGMGFAGSITRLTRVNIIDVLDQGFITTARSKGLAESGVLSRHALKPAMIPVVTVIGLQMAVILGGAVITETLFNLPGLGKLIVDSIYLRDFPVVQGAMLMLAFGFVIINLLVDMLYGMLDPRIKHG